MLRRTYAPTYILETSEAAQRQTGETWISPTDSGHGGERYVIDTIYLPTSPCNAMGANVDEHGLPINVLSGSADLWSFPFSPRQ